MTSCIASLLQLELGNTHSSNHMWSIWLYFDKSILLLKTVEYPLLLNLEIKKCALNKLIWTFLSQVRFYDNECEFLVENSSDLGNLDGLKIYENFLSIFGAVILSQHSWFHGVVVEMLCKLNWALEGKRWYEVNK